MVRRLHLALYEGRFGPERRGREGAQLTNGLAKVRKRGRAAHGTVVDARAFLARGISGFRYLKSCSYKGAQIELMIPANDTAPAKRKIAELQGEVEKGKRVEVKIMNLGLSRKTFKELEGQLVEATDGPRAEREAREQLEKQVLSLWRIRA